MNRKRVLLVEDELLIALDEKQVLENLGYEVTGIETSGEAALRSVEADCPDLVLMDIMLDGSMDGIEAATVIRTRYDLPVVYVTAYADERLIERAKQTEPFGYVVKPFAPKSLDSCIELALYKHAIERRLRDSERTFRSLIEFTNVVHWVADVPTGKFLYVGPQIEAMLGSPAETWTDASVWVEHVHPDDRERTVRAFREGRAAGESVEIEYRAIAADGRIVWIRDSASATIKETNHRQSFGFMVEITRFKKQAFEKDRLQRELWQARKMQALGQLTGGIAHDFNNILGIMLGNTELAMNRCVHGEQEKLIGYLRNVEKAGFRARDLVAQMLTYTQGTAGNHSPLHLRPLLEGNIKVIRAGVSAGIEIKAEIEENLPAVKMDFVQIGQLLMNLCTNAGDAMEGEGTINLRLGWAGHLDRECVICHRLLEGDWVELSVEDSGVGIAHESLDSVFDPFFTTKEVGKGTGLGLSVVSGIMRSHGGHIQIETAFGKGTTIRLLFPPVLEEAVEETHRCLSGSKTDLPRGYSELI